MSIEDYSENPFALSADDAAKLDAIEQALLDPSPRRIGRLDQWGLADTYEVQAEIAEYRQLSIAMADGTMIDASLSVPRNLAPGQTCPAILMPAPLNDLGHRAYLPMIPRWALGGYAVLAYSQRGLAKSTGEIHVAGPQDVADATEIVNSLIQIEGIDPERIGCFGASYGAGTSLLAAANDLRIKAVVGTSAWTDLFASLYENGTRHLAAFEALVKLFKEERCSAEFKGIIQKIRGNIIDDEVRKFAGDRSPKNRLQAYNDSRVPILMTTAWHETIFSVPAVIDMFNDLTGPKSLLVQIGDHGNSELPGLLGLVSKPTEMAYRWMDHHLGGTAGDGAEPQFGIRSEYMHNLLSDLHHEDWRSYALPKKRFHLADAAPGERDGRMSEGTPHQGWTRSVKVAVHDTEAVVAPKLIQTGLAERAGLPHVYKTADIDRGLAAIWTTAPLPQAMRVQGDLELRVTLTPQAPDATIVAYLMDCDPATGKANIITNAPCTVTNQEPRQATTVTFPLQPAHYVLRKGHQLQLIIDTHDQFYAGANRAPSSIDLTSPQGSESYLDIPLSALP
ncbi:ABC transporter ATP-binding protein [Streptomyces venezuelae]|uniref:CocE/NonD family hydrolase n=1 Tax=Streptomyces gardneri TaxID=66892 RepID=UPI0006BDE346|nr:CocE/NonD family hydrolase [Streptomyces gardneri]ALO08335.1 ABC transporter ATP-binding protein [Streptomyces venezuelae]QPK45558.1 acetylxylan esterase [Streptomyces gardneri]WRK36901.1 CocE/NonD family hydrolase [Streptomyces venezuelae]CUM41310.1 putative ABC transporter ATP-binding protein [Streptomyces venezuelae]